MSEVKVGDKITVGKYDRYTRIADRYRHECEVIYVESDGGDSDGDITPYLQPRLGYEYIHLEYVTLTKDSKMKQMIQKIQVIAKINESYYGKDAYVRKKK